MKKIFVLTFLIFFSNGLAQSRKIENQGLQQFGLQDKVITSLAAEQSDYQTNIQITDYIFAGTDSGVFKTVATSDSSNWISIGLENKSVTALTLQHWGIGPADGLTLFAAVSPDYEQGDSTLILKKEVYLLTDTSWVASDSGIDKSSAGIYALNSYYFSGQEPPQPILAGGSNGLFQASRIDYFWSRSEIEGESSQPVISAIDVASHWWASQNRTAWAAGYSGSSPDVFPIALRSTDKGLTWKIFTLSNSQSSATSIAINTRNPDSVYVSWNNAIYLTPDSGDNWETVFTSRGDFIHTLAIDPLNPENIFAGGWFFDDSPSHLDHGILLQSTNGGKDWDEPDPATDMQLKEVNSIAVSRKPNDNYGFVFVGTAGTGVWRYKYNTLNNDASSYFPLALNNEWNYNSNLFPQTEKITDTLRINNKLYFGFSVDNREPFLFFRQSANKVFVLDKTDSTETMLYNFDAEIGESWELPENFYCNYGEVITLVSKSDTVETPAGTFYNCYHFLHSSPCYDAGITDTWLAKGRGKVRYKEIFFAGEGDFVLTDNITSTDKNSKHLQDLSFRLFQNYPNPFNPITTIKYDLPKGTTVQLNIYNILGERVAELINTFQKAGSHSVEWNANKLASGVYIYRMKAGDFISSRKLVLLK